MRERSRGWHDPGVSDSASSAGGGVFDLDAERLWVMFREQLRRGRTVVVRQTLSMPDGEHLAVRVTAEVSGKHTPIYEVAFTVPWREGDDRPDLTGINPLEAVADGEERLTRAPSANGNHVRKPREG
jgi:hypothetical protein